MAKTDVQKAAMAAAEHAISFFLEEEETMDEVAGAVDEANLDEDDIDDAQTAAFALIKEAKEAALAFLKTKKV